MDAHRPLAVARGKGTTLNQNIMSGVYLLHFSEPYKHARHYIGWANQIEARLDHHNNGTGARLTQVVRAVGIDLILAKVWEGESKTFERSLKNKKHSSRFCPICQQLKKG